MLKRLVLFPRAGLGNRLRVLASGLRLCDRLRAECQVYWDWGALESLVEIQALKQVFRLPEDGVRVRHECFGEPFFVPVDGPETIILDSAMLFAGDDEKNNPVQHEEQIAVWFPRPSAQIQIAVAEITEYWPTSVLGVHIRAADRGRESPSIEEIWDLFAPHLEGWPGDFFLTSNDQDLVNYAAERVSSYVRGQHKRKFRAARWPRRPDEENNDLFREDMIDLQLLAKCSKIVGSAWSSFSRIAAVYGRTTAASVFVPGRHFGKNYPTY